MSFTGAARTKFGRDLIWNLVAFAILGASGILLNVIIGRYYDASVLGVFNQVFAHIQESSASWSAQVFTSSCAQHIATYGFNVYVQLAHCLTRIQ